jgi:hypothetical protein
MNRDDRRFFRGTRVLAPCNHIVLVETRAGCWQLRRVSLSAETMGKLEARLMALQHENRIKSYIITAAEDCDFAGLLAWLKGFSEDAQQGELISIEQNTLFAYGKDGAA